MARQINRLSALAVKNQTKPGYHPDGGGLYLQISNSGTKSWIFRYTLNGKSREMGIGSFNTINLAQAREIAVMKRQLLQDGHDPIDSRDAQRRALATSAANRITFESASEKYIAAKKAEWKNDKHREQWINSLATYANPFIGKMFVCEIDTPDILKCLEPIWATKNETATRVRGRIERILDWATSRKYRTGENPARWKNHLELSLAMPSKVQKVAHHPALPFAQLPAFMTSLRNIDSVSARALEFTILTAVRSNESIGAKWDEFDLEAGVWTIPAERMKMKTEHRVPLSAKALEVLGKMKEIKKSDYVFPGRVGNESTLSNMAMIGLIRRMTDEDDKPLWIDPKSGRTVVPHGFRSTFRDWASETTNYPRDVAEMALAHSIDDKTEAAYRRGDLFDKRAMMMNDWANFCS